MLRIHISLSFVTYAESVGVSKVEGRIYSKMFKPEEVMPKLQIMQDLSKESLLVKMSADLKAFTRVIKSGEFRRITSDLSIHALAAKLLEARDLCLTLPPKEIPEALQHLKRYLFVLDRHQAALWPVDPSVRQPLNDAIQLISDQIGVVPQIKSPVASIEPTATAKRRWQAQPCYNPHRGEDSKAGGIHFIKEDGKSAIRGLLAKEAEEPGSIFGFSLDGFQYSLNVIDGRFYDPRLMHADHLLPSRDLISRIKLMVDAMNDDPTFKREMMRLPSNQGYFSPPAVFPPEPKTDRQKARQKALQAVAQKAVAAKGLKESEISEGGEPEIPDEEVVGSYWLYMAYHNSTENLWFLLASDNSGGGKVAADPVMWLETTEVGKEYLAHLKTSGQAIDKSDVLYRLTDGTSLKNSFLTWFAEAKKYEVKTNRAIFQMHEGVREAYSSGAMSAGVGVGQDLRGSASAAVSVDGALPLGTVGRGAGGMTEAQRHKEYLDIRATTTFMTHLFPALTEASISAMLPPADDDDLGVALAGDGRDDDDARSVASGESAEYIDEFSEQAQQNARIQALVRELGLALGDVKKDAKKSHNAKKRDASDPSRKALFDAARKLPRQVVKPPTAAVDSDDARGVPKQIFAKIQASAKRDRPQPAVSTTDPEVTKVRRMGPVPGGT